MVRRIQINVVFSHFYQCLTLLVCVENRVDVELVIVGYDVYPFFQIKDEMEPVAELSCVCTQISFGFCKNQIHFSICTIPHKPQHLRTLGRFFITGDVDINIHECAILKITKPSFNRISMKGSYLTLIAQIQFCPLYIATDSENPLCICAHTHRLCFFPSFQT